MIFSTKQSSSEHSQQIQSILSRSSRISNDVGRNSQNERRKMLNRKAAARLRQKKKKEIKGLQNRNNNLKNEIEQMECTIDELKRQIMELEMKNDAFM